MRCQLKLKVTLVDEKENHQSPKKGGMQENEDIKERKRI